MCRVVKILLSGGIRGAEHRKCGHWVSSKTAQDLSPPCRLGPRPAGHPPTALPWAFWPTKMAWTILWPIPVMSESKAHCFALSWFGLLANSTSKGASKPHLYNTFSVPKFPGAPASQTHGLLHPQTREGTLLPPPTGEAPPGLPTFITRVDSLCNEQAAGLCGSPF